MKFSKKNIIILSSLLIVLFVFMTILVNSVMNKNSKLNFLSYKFFVASVDEMESNTNKGDLVIVKQVQNDEIKNGDNIVYKVDDNIVIKKVMDISNNDGETKLSFNGVKSSVNSVDIMGKMTGKIAGVGNLSILLQTPTGTILVLSTLICIVIIIKKIYNKNELDDDQDEDDNEPHNEDDDNSNILNNENSNNASKTDRKEVH